MIKILNSLEEHGLRASYIPYSRISDIAMDYEALLNGELQTKFLKGAVNHFTKNMNPQLPFKPESILIAAIPSPIAQMHINRNEKRIAIKIPPTYVDGNLKK